MSVMHIRQSVHSAIDHYAEQPGKARAPGALVAAVVQKVLRRGVRTQVYQHRPAEHHRDHQEYYLRASGSRYVSPVR